MNKEGGFSNLERTEALQKALEELQISHREVRTSQQVLQQKREKVLGLLPAEADFDTLLIFHSLDEMLAQEGFSSTLSNGKITLHGCHTLEYEKIVLEAGGFEIGAPPTA